MTNKHKPGYMVWAQMKYRCMDPKAAGYKNYGGRGIKVCERWMVFANFISDMGVPPKGMTLDRWPDANGDYEPGNCRWATPLQQSRNKRNNLMLTAFGRTQCLAAWAEEFAIRKDTLGHRIHKQGMTLEQAVTAPVLNPTQSAQIRNAVRWGKRAPSVSDVASAALERIQAQTAGMRRVA